MNVAVNRVEPLAPLTVGTTPASPAMRQSFARSLVAAGTGAFTQALVSGLVRQGQPLRLSPTFFFIAGFLLTNPARVDVRDFMLVAALTSGATAVVSTVPIVGNDG